MKAGYFFLAALLFISNTAFSQPEVILAGITESRGAGAIAGTNFKNGYTLAIEEVNANGGLAGKKITVRQFDIDTSPDSAKQAAASAVAEKPFVVLGPVFSGLTLATIPVIGAAGIPQFTGAEAASVTRAYATHLFRTSLTQEISVPRMAWFVRSAFQPRRIAFVWVDNPFGRDGKELFAKTISRLGPAQVEDITVKPGQQEFSGEALHLKRSPPDVLVVYTNETEAAGLLKALKRHGFDRPIVGEGPVASQQVIDLADGAAESVYVHTGASVDAPNARIAAFAQKYQERFRTRPDHNSLKGYFAVLAIKAVVDANGKPDRDTLLPAMKKARFDPARQPGLPARGSYDMFGNLYRESFLVRIRNGRQAVIATIPPTEGQTVDLTSGKEIYLNSNEGRKLFFSDANSTR